MKISTRSPSHPANAVMQISFKTRAGETLALHIVELSGHLAQLCFSPSAGRSLERGQLKQLAIESPWLPLPMNLVARVASVQHGVDVTTAVFRFVDPVRVRSQCPPELLPLFGQRFHHRKTPTDADQVQVTLEGPSLGFPQSCRLRDLSAGGLALSLPAGAPRPLEHGEELRATLVLPGQDQPVSVLGQVTHARNEQDRTVVGLAFTKKSA